MQFLEIPKMMAFARTVIDPRLKALREDVAHCLQGQCAPFPAIILCFSTIDLLGALAGGDAKKSRKTTDQSKAFMQEYMLYSEDHATLLMNLFRHKLVHLASPKPVVAFQKKNVAWKYLHSDSALHRVFKPINPPEPVNGFPGIPLTADHVFSISIQHFADDIAEAVTRGTDGYYAKLETSADLQIKFVAASYDLYDPNQ
jgi:hypothetical protein